MCIRDRSGGEQAKGRLCKLVNKGTNILLLDEPTNHLDVDAKEALKQALIEYKGSILLICHEPVSYTHLLLFHGLDQFIINFLRIAVKHADPADSFDLA